jgi:hypothetical protein
MLVLKVAKLVEVIEVVVIVVVVVVAHPVSTMTVEFKTKSVLHRILIISATIRDHWCASFLRGQHRYGLMLVAEGSRKINIVLFFFFI